MYAEGNIGIVALLGLLLLLLVALRPNQFGSYKNIVASMCSPSISERQTRLYPPHLIFLFSCEGTACPFVFSLRI